MIRCFLINKSHTKGSIDLKEIIFIEVDLVDLYSILNLYFLEMNVKNVHGERNGYQLQQTIK